MNFKIPIPFGARILKTGLAVGLSLFFADLLKIEPKIFAAVTALINIQPSVYRSFKNAGEQVLTHVVSVVIALIFGYIIGSGPVQMALITVIVISVNKKLGLTQTIAMGVVAAIFILDAPKHDFIAHAVSRSYVIFVGLITALGVNVLIAPPNYKDKLLQVLEKLNTATSDFFTESVERFIDLNLFDDKSFQIKREEIKGLLRESRSYLEFYKEQLGRQVDFNHKVLIYERFINYNANIYHSSRDTYIATEQRIEWRKQQGDPPITGEFEAILEMLRHGVKSFAELNYQLRNAVIYEKYQSVPPVSESFWQELSEYIDCWHNKLTGAHFLHALMFVSLVANDIKLANRGIKEFLKDIERLNIEQRSKLKNLPD